jgi:MFS-type transporter involved in bile tolerance (Atg22 family)
MKEIFKNLVLLGLISGIVFLISSNLNGWGWLVLLYILTLILNEDNNITKNNQDGNN